MALNSKKGQIFNEINITPLTDIFLVLLIIMMVVAPLLDQQGLNLLVPSNVEQQQMAETPQILTIQVTDNNEYFIKDTHIRIEELEEYIRTNKTKDGVLIQPQENANHGAVVKAMDAVRNAGVSNIAIGEG